MYIQHHTTWSSNFCSDGIRRTILSMQPTTRAIDQIILKYGLTVAFSVTMEVDLWFCTIYTEDLLELIFIEGPHIQIRQIIGGYWIKKAKLAFNTRSEIHGQSKLRPTSKDLTIVKLSSWKEVNLSTLRYIGSFLEVGKSDAIINKTGNLSHNT